MPSTIAVKRWLRHNVMQREIVPDSKASNSVLRDTAYGAFRALNRSAAPAADPFSRSFVSDEHRFVFLTNPKVATTSVRNTLRTHEKLMVRFRPDERPIDAIIADDPKVADYFVFSFVRNPWDRAYSSYRDKVRDPRALEDLRRLARYRDLRPGATFPDFVRWLETEEGGDRYADRHWISQSSLLHRPDGTPRCHFVGRFETLSDDFAKVLATVGLPHVDIRKINVTGGNRAPEYRAVYTDAMREAVGRRYAVDIASFSYAF